MRIIYMYGEDKVMLRDREFFDLMNKKITQLYGDPKRIKPISEKINKKFDIPQGLLTDYLTLRVPVEDASDFVLFGLSEEFFSTFQIQKHFSEEEIKFYSKTKFKVETISYPLKFDMIQINTSQWIGRITAKQLMEFRDAQIINYNERTQRTMERKVSHGYEYYQIAINDIAVKEIENSYEKGIYIPNTITLNLSDDSEADFVYDGEHKQLIIKKLKYFDILDGYHRYKAISKAYNMDDDFDYEMELRIVNFSEKQARQFIWQEDQKTKMNKIDSASYNQNDWSVYICERIAKNLPSGTVSRNKGTIDLGSLAACVKPIYDTNNIKNASEANKIARTITERLEIMQDEHPEGFDKKWGLPLTTCVILLIYEEKDDIWDKANTLYHISIKEKMWINNTIYKKRVTALQKLMNDNNI